MPALEACWKALMVESTTCSHSCRHHSTAKCQRIQKLPEASTWEPSLAYPLLLSGLNRRTPAADWWEMQQSRPASPSWASSNFKKLRAKRGGRRDLHSPCLPYCWTQASYSMFLCLPPKIYLISIVGAQIFELSLNHTTSCFGSPFSRKYTRGFSASIVMAWCQWIPSLPWASQGCENAGCYLIFTAVPLISIWR